MNQGNIFSELSSRLIPVATLAGAQGHGLSCRPFSWVQPALLPGGSAPLGRWPGEPARPCVRPTKCASACACMYEGWVAALGLSLIWHPRPCPEPTSLPPGGEGSQDICSRDINACLSWPRGLQAETSKTNLPPQPCWEMCRLIPPCLLPKAEALIWGCVSITQLSPTDPKGSQAGFARGRRSLR